MNSTEKVAFVSGSGKRIGAAIANNLHDSGFRVALHYRTSKIQALELEASLNQRRANSAKAFYADLNRIDELKRLAKQVTEYFPRLDVVVNNASTMRRSSLSDTSDDAYAELFGIHCRAPYFLIQSFFPALQNTRGCIVNITDIYAKRPIKDYALYCASKAALDSLTRSLALELAPDVRVNAIAPGAILWQQNESESPALIANTPLKRIGNVEEICRAVQYLVTEATFTTGQTLVIDGGRSIPWSKSDASNGD